MSQIQKVNVPSIGVRVVQPSVEAEANDWWDPNDAGLCIVGAYRAINTPGNPWINDRPSVYADTLVNNANPGVNDLAETAGAIPWNINSGWQPVAAGMQAFNTGIVSNVNYTLIVQFTGHVVGVIAGVDNINIGSPTAIHIWPTPFANIRYSKGNITAVAPYINNGNFAVSRLTVSGYRNGAPEGGAHAWFGAQTGAIAICAKFNPFTGLYDQYCTANVESVAIYSCILSDADILAIATAMAQL